MQELSKTHTLFAGAPAAPFFKNTGMCSSVFFNSITWNDHNGPKKMPQSIGCFLNLITCQKKRACTPERYALVHTPVEGDFIDICRQPDMSGSGLDSVCMHVGGLEVLSVYSFFWIFFHPYFSTNSLPFTMFKADCWSMLRIWAKYI